MTPPSQDLYYLGQCIKEIMSIVGTIYSITIWVKQKQNNNNNLGKTCFYFCYSDSDVYRDTKGLTTRKVNGITICFNVGSVFIVGDSYCI